MATLVTQARHRFTTKYCSVLKAKNTVNTPFFAATFVMKSGDVVEDVTKRPILHIPNITQGAPGCHHRWSGTLSDTFGVVAALRRDHGAFRGACCRVGSVFVV